MPLTGIIALGYLDPVGANATQFTMDSANDKFVVFGSFDFTVTGLAGGTVTFAIADTLNGAGPNLSTTMTQTLTLTSGNTYQVSLSGVLSGFNPGDVVNIGIAMPATALIGTTINIGHEMFTAMRITASSVTGGCSRIDPRSLRWRSRNAKRGGSDSIAPARLYYSRVLVICSHRSHSPAALVRDVH